VRRASSITFTFLLACAVLLISSGCGKNDHSDDGPQITDPAQDPVGPKVLTFSTRPDLAGQAGLDSEPLVPSPCPGAGPRVYGALVPANLELEQMIKREEGLVAQYRYSGVGHNRNLQLFFFQLHDDLDRGTAENWIVRVAGEDDATVVEGDYITLSEATEYVRREAEVDLCIDPNDIALTAEVEGGRVTLWWEMGTPVDYDCLNQEGDQILRRGVFRVNAATGVVHEMEWRETLSFHGVRRLPSLPDMEVKGWGDGDTLVVSSAGSDYRAAAYGGEWSLAETPIALIPLEIDIRAHLEHPTGREWSVLPHRSHGGQEQRTEYLQISGPVELTLHPWGADEGIWQVDQVCWLTDDVMAFCAHRPGPIGEGCYEFTDNILWLGHLSRWGIEYAQLGPVPNSRLWPSPAGSPFALLELDPLLVADLEEFVPDRLRRYGPPVFIAAAGWEGSAAAARSPLGPHVMASRVIQARWWDDEQLMVAQPHDDDLGDLGPTGQWLWKPYHTSTRASDGAITGGSPEGLPAGYVQVSHGAVTPTLYHGGSRRPDLVASWQPLSLVREGRSEPMLSRPVWQFAVDPTGARTAYVDKRGLWIVGDGEEFVDSAEWMPHGSDGSEVIQESPSCPAWSPDGRRLAYLTACYEDWGTVKVYDTETGEKQEGRYTQASAPLWLDNDRLIYTTFTDADKLKACEPLLVILWDLETGESRAVAQSAWPLTVHEGMVLVRSRSVREGNPHTLHWFDPATGDWIRVASAPAEFEWADASPDGRRVAYGRRDVPWAVYVVPSGLPPQ